ncbi:MAG: hypothetical protein J6W00_08790 [Lentisphaeria bacterium]|nr:hypothetical protein [Lentisphaeria bacterium]
MSFLLLDFGASRVKSAVLTADTRSLVHFSEWAPVPPAVCGDSKFEVRVQDLKALFEKIVAAYREKFAVSGICVCTEMHGFAVLDQNNVPLSNYISWQDEREHAGRKKVLPDFLKAFSPQHYLEVTGMNHAASPIANLLHVVAEVPERTVKIVTMPELFVSVPGGKDAAAHISSSAGLGLWDWGGRCWSSEIIDFVGQYTGHKLIFNEVATTFKPAGFCMGIPVFCGMGDLQCAVIGAGNDEASISVNLGTGSQVSQIGKSDIGFERRPVFRDVEMQTVTHIPSGRVLNHFIAFLRELAPGRDFWQELASCPPERISDATLDFDLALFSGAWNYSGGGSVSGIGEKNLTADNFLASLLKSYTGQYIKIIKTFDFSLADRLIFSGGIANKIPAVREVIAAETGIPAEVSGVAEETLEGLKKLIITNNLI